MKLDHEFVLFDDCFNDGIVTVKQNNCVRCKNTFTSSLRVAAGFRFT